MWLHVSGLGLQVQLLCVASEHGDLKSVSYLLKEAHITCPQDPSNSNPAVLAAFHGHTSVVRELLDSVPGTAAVSTSPIVRSYVVLWLLTFSVCLRLRSLSEEGTVELDVVHFLSAGSPGRGAAAGPTLRR